MSSLCVILGRAGSKGLPNKNLLPLAGRPMIAWSIAHAQSARHVDHLLVSTDGPAIARAATEAGAPVILRPGELASDTATVDTAARHAVERFEADHADPQVDFVVILYANVPIRPPDLIDRAIDKLRQTGCDSVQSVCPVGKMHPYWMKTLAGDSHDELAPYQPNTVYRRQDLPSVYMLDGGIIAVRRSALFTGDPMQPHAFLGHDRRAIITQPHDVIDIDEPHDLALAEAVLQQRKAQPCP